MADIYATRTTCRLCDGSSLRPILSLGDQYLIRFTNQPTTELPHAPLDLVRCDHCGLLQLRHTVKPDLLFRDFWYRSSINQSMRTALQDVVDDAMVRVKSGAWLDIGANDGFLLSAVPESFVKIACEPAQNFRPQLEEHADVLIDDYFSADHAALASGVDVVTSIAMFYDLDDPNEFVADIARILNPGGIWVNQLNDAPTMLEALSIDGICHEHLTYYDVPTLERLYRRHGLRIVGISFNDVNGGSVRVTATKGADRTQAVDLLGIRSASLVEAEAFARRAARWKNEMAGLLEEFRHDGLWGYGASTKGSTLLQYLGVTPTTMAGIADRNPAKHGLFMPGTGIRINSEQDFREAAPPYALVLPYAFRKEFDAREAMTRAKGTTFIYPLPDISLVV